MDTIWAQHCQNLFFSTFLSRIVNIDVFNSLTKFESQISSYKRVAEVRILCFVNKARVLLIFTYLLYWYKVQSNVAVFCNNFFYEPSESVCLVYTSYFDKEMAISLLYSIRKQILDSSFVYITNFSPCISPVTWLVASTFWQIIQNNN